MRPSERLRRLAAQGQPMDCEYYARQARWAMSPTRCSQCNDWGSHFVPPSFGAEGFFICEAYGDGDMRKLNQRELEVLGMVAKFMLVKFMHEPRPRGRHTVVTESTVDPSLQSEMHDLALGGYLAAHVDGSWEDCTSTTSYTLTALGRDAIGLHAPTPRTHNRDHIATPQELEREGIE